MAIPVLSEVDFRKDIKTAQITPSLLEDQWLNYTTENIGINLDSSEWEATGYFTKYFNNTIFQSERLVIVFDRIETSYFPGFAIGPDETRYGFRIILDVYSTEDFHLENAEGYKSSINLKNENEEILLKDFKCICKPFMYYDPSSGDFVSNPEDTAFIYNQQKQASNNDTDSYKDYQFKMNIHFNFATTEGASKEEEYNTNINIQAQIIPHFYTMPLFGEEGSLNYLDKKRAELYQTLTDDYNKKIQALNTELTENINTNKEDISELSSRLDNLGFNGGHVITTKKVSELDDPFIFEYEVGYVAQIGKIVYGYLCFQTLSDVPGASVQITSLYGSGIEFIKNTIPENSFTRFYYRASEVSDYWASVDENGITLNNQEQPYVYVSTEKYPFWYVIDSQFEPNKS